jgi:putative DNA primase/helicase
VTIPTTAQPDKPIALSLEPGNIPLELTERKQFVCWRNEFHNGRWTKVPYQPNGQKAKANDPTTFHTWESGLAGYHDEFSGYDGINIGLTSGDPYVAIDLDGCVDAQNGTIEPWAQEIIGRFASSESSP